MSTTQLPAYPVAVPEDGTDPRFVFGLVVNVAREIEAAGYPPVTTGRDLVRLQQALYAFCYADGDQ